MVDGNLIVQAQPNVQMILARATVVLSSIASLAIGFEGGNPDHWVVEQPSCTAAYEPTSRTTNVTYTIRRTFQNGDRQERSLNAIFRNEDLTNTSMSSIHTIPAQN